MSTQENKQMIMEGYREFQNGEIDKLLSRYHDDAEWIAPDSDLIPFAGSFHGKQEIAQFFRTFDASVQAIRFAPRDFFAEGDKVIVTGEATWLAKPTGRTFDSLWVHIFTLRDGKIAHFDSLYDTAASERAFRPAQPGQRATDQPLHH